MNPVPDGVRQQLLGAQRIGIIGPTEVDTEIEHAFHYVPGIPPDARDVVDLGSGAGLPALVIAVALPHLHLTLVERRLKRADFLRRAVGALRLRDRVDVVADDVRRVRSSSATRNAFDVVTARAFGPPHWTLECATDLLRPGGVVVLSLPPDSATRELSLACQTAGATFSLVDGGKVAIVRWVDKGSRRFEE